MGKYIRKQSVIDNTNIQESTSLTSSQKPTTQPGFEHTTLFKWWPRYRSSKTGHLTCKPYGLVGNVRRGAAVLPTNFGGGQRCFSATGTVRARCVPSMHLENGQKQDLIDIRKSIHASLLAYQIYLPWVSLHNESQWRLANFTKHHNYFNTSIIHCIEWLRSLCFIGTFSISVGEIDQQYLLKVCW